MTYVFTDLYPSTTYDINVYTKNKKPGAPEKELVGPPAYVSVTTVAKSEL